MHIAVDGASLFEDAEALMGACLSAVEVTVKDIQTSRRYPVNFPRIRSGWFGGVAHLRSSVDLHGLGAIIRCLSVLLGVITT